MEQQENKNLNISDLIDLAYQIAKENYGKENFSFNSIWSKTWKSASSFNKEKVEDWIGYFYTELLLDPRFVLFNFNNWKLKEYMTFTEMKKLERTIFEGDLDFDDSSEVEKIEEEVQEEGEVVAMVSDDDDIPEDKAAKLEEGGDSERVESEDFDQLDSEI